MEIKISNRSKSLSESISKPKSLPKQIANKKLYKKYLKELYYEQQEETLKQISNYVRKNCRYLEKHFQEEKQQRKQIENLDNENLMNLYQAKDYQKIDTKMYQFGINSLNSQHNPTAKNEKVVIKRRILNDYMNIINKRQELVEEIDENFLQLFEMHQGTLHYYNKYYSQANEKQYYRLQNMLLPEFRYILRFISNKGRQFATRLRNYSDIKYDNIKSSFETLNSKRARSLTEPQTIASSPSNFIKSNDNSLITRVKPNKADGSQDTSKKDNQSKEQRLKTNGEEDREGSNKDTINMIQKKALFQKQKFENLAKSKGYFYLENSDSNEGKFNNFEVQKYGSDKMKLKIFEQDMRQLIRDTKTTELNNSMTQTKRQNNQTTQSPPQQVKQEQQVQRKTRKQQKLSVEQEQKQMLLNTVKDTIQNFKKLSFSGEQLQNILQDKFEKQEIFQQSKQSKSQQQQNLTQTNKSKKQTPSRKSISFFQNRATLKSLDVDFNSYNNRINRKQSMSQLIQMKEYQSFHEQPLILKDDVSFKKFKEKYFQQGNSNEEEIKPYIQQISIKELKNSSLPSLPLTINELKNSLLSQFSQYQAYEKSQKEQNKIVEIEEENMPSNKYVNSKQINTNQSEGFSEWMKSFSTSKFIKTEQNSYIKDTKETDSPSQMSYFSTKQFENQMKQQIQIQRIQSKEQMSNIQLPKQDMFIQKKLNKIYLDKIYNERILNKRFQGDIQPLFTPQDLSYLRKNSKANLPLVNGPEPNKRSKSRMWKSVPFIPLMLSQKLIKDPKKDKDSKNNKEIQSSSKDGRNSFSKDSNQKFHFSNQQNDQKKLKSVSSIILKKPPSLQCFDHDKDQDNQNLLSQETQEQFDDISKKISFQSPSLKGIATYSDIYSVVTDNDKTTPKVLSPNKFQGKLYFNFNQSQKQAKENEQKLTLQLNQKLSQQIDEQDQNDSESITSSNSSNSSISSLDEMKQQVSKNINKSQLSSGTTQIKSNTEQSDSQKNQLPHLKQYQVKTESINSQSLTQSQKLRQEKKPDSPVGTPQNVTFSTNLSQSQPLCQMYPTDKDFVDEKKSSLLDSTTKDQAKKSLSFLSIKSNAPQQQQTNSSNNSINRKNKLSGIYTSQSQNTSQIMVKDLSPINSSFTQETSKRNTIQNIFNRNNSISRNSKYQFDNSSISPSPLNKIENERSLLNTTFQTLNKQIITQQNQISKLSDQVFFNKKEQQKLFDFINKKYDLCIEKKEKSFKQYIKEINLPLDKQLEISQKEKIQRRLSVCEQLQLDKELNKLNQKKRFQKLSIISNVSVGSQVQDVFPSRQSVISQNEYSIQRLKSLPQNVEDLLLKNKRSKYIISAQQSSILTKKLQEFESGGCYKSYTTN